MEAILAGLLEQSPYGLALILLIIGIRVLYKDREKHADQSIQDTKLLAVTLDKTGNLLERGLAD